MSRARQFVRGSRMLLQHIFRAYARRIGIDGQRIGLKFISRRSKRPAKSVIPLLRSFRMLFRSFGVRRAISVVRASHASSRGVIHLLPDPSCNHPATTLRPGRDADSHSTTRRLAYRNFSLSDPYSSFSPSSNTRVTYVS